MLVYTTANIVNISVFEALSIGSGLTAAVYLCVKQDDIYFKTETDTKLITPTPNTNL